MESTQQNDPGLGIEYEVHVAAYFALLLSTNPDVEDFELKSNVKNHGKFDDLLVDIKTKSGKLLYFAFQLKHKEKSDKQINSDSFLKPGGDWSLKKYCEAFKTLDKQKKKYHCILYTNSNFNSNNTKRVNKFNMKMAQDTGFSEKIFFNTSDNGNNLFEFEVNGETEEANKDHFREFFTKFTLYTKQANVRGLDILISDILKNKDCYAKYIVFFRRWHRGDFIDKILDKKTLNVHLVDTFLSSVAINYYLSDGQDVNLNFFETMIQQFDVTIIDASKQDLIKQLEKNIQKYPQEFNNSSEKEIIELGRKSKFIDRFAEGLGEEAKLKLLHYFFQKPLILDFHELSENVIYDASKLCRIQEIGIKLVFVGKAIDVNKFSHLKIFRNLMAVNPENLEEIKRRCNLSLQGRNILFAEILENEIRELVTPRHIFQMLKGNFSIGGDEEILPESYISRTVSATVFDIESIIKRSSGSAAVIFYYEDKFEELKILIQSIVDSEDYLYEDILDGIILRKEEPSKQQLHQNDSKNMFPEMPTIILRKEQFSKQQLEEIRKKTGKGDIRLFKVIDEKRCLLLMTDTSFKENYESTKMPVEENNIHVFFNNYSINVLCAQPGMGKSSLMKYLKNQCDPNFWTVIVDLKADNQFLKRNHNIEDVLNYFLKLENCQDLFLSNIKRMFLNKKKIVLFLDGLDEVENECIDHVLSITSQLSEMGFRIWLSSRQNLQQRIEQYFNIFTIEIKEVNDNQQKNYIANTLKSLYNKHEIEEIVDLIFSNTDLANNRQILEIPLQLYIITQIFLDDKSHYFNMKKNNLFTLTKMFEIFFEGKYKHFLTRVGLNYTDKDEVKYYHFLKTVLEEQLTKYEIVALHSVLDDEHFQMLQIDKSTATHIKNWDFLGIITGINRENKAVFEHLTFAEYFASKFLAKNFDKARILKEEIFSEKYQNLLLIFNIILAENNPLHLAIIYKDLDRIEIGQSSLVDKGGRNSLQVVACVATRHPLLESNYPDILFRRNNWFLKKLIPAEFKECLVKDKSVYQFRGEDPKIKKIVNRVLFSDPSKKDEIFKWNSLDYALAAGALCIVEAILEKFEKPPSFYELLGKYYSDEVVAYYSIRFGYHRLLSEIIAKNSCRVTGILSDYLSKEDNNSIFHFLFDTSVYTNGDMNRSRIVELLNGDNINKTDDKYGYTLLHFAVFHEDIEFVKFLLQRRAFVNVKDKDGLTPLFWAVRRNNLKISKLLVENGADVNMKNEYGRSPLFFVKRYGLEIANFLIEKGADVNIRDKYGSTPLPWAVRRNYLEISKLLVEKGSNVNNKDKYGASPLLWAVRRNYLEISKLLVEKGADVNNIKDEFGRSPMLIAIDIASLEISRLLIEKGADVNIKDKEGKSPLFWAVERDNLEISKLLLERGAEVNCQAKRSKTTLSSVIESIRLIFRKEANVNEASKISPVLRLAVKNGNLNLVRILIENGAIWDARILDAIEGGNIQIS